MSIIVCIENYVDNLKNGFLSEIAKSTYIPTREYLRKINFPRIKIVEGSKTKKWISFVLDLKRTFIKRE